MRGVRLILWVFSILAAGELALEVRAHRRGWQTLLFDAPERHAAGGGSAEYGPTDDFPFRSRIVSPEREAGVPRYWLASASYAEDLSLPPDRIFPSRVAALLSRPGRPVEVLNASRAGDSIPTNVETLRALAPRWKPDAAILYQLFPDVNALTERFLGNAPAPDPEGAAGGAPAGAGWTVRLFESTTVWALLKANVTSRLASARVLADALPEPAHAAFEERVRAFVASARDVGATPILCTFAASHAPRHLPDLPRLTTLFLLRYNPHLSPAGWVRSVESLNDSIRRIASDEGVALIDLASRLGGRPELFKDFVHPNAQGHEIAAEAIADALAEDG